MITVEEHVASAVALVRRLDVEAVPLGACVGRTLAQDVRAVLATPPFDASAMDGFAVRAADLHGASPESAVRLRVVGEAAAIAQPVARALSAGQAVRIMTGAPVPAGADAVVPVEQTALGRFEHGSRAGNDVAVLAAAVPGQFVRPLGGDLGVGDLVLAAGKRLGPRDLASAAASGHGALAVRRTPRVGVIVTGNELVAPGSMPRHGEIVDANGLLLELWLRGRGAEPLSRRVRDDEDALTAVLDELAPRCDLLITAGGVSAGAHDVVRHVLGAEGVEMPAVAMQPGKPQAVGRWRGTPVLGLPGNPVSVFVSAEIIVAPVLNALSGAGADRQVWRLRAGQAWASPRGRRQYLPAVVDHTAGTVAPATVGGSGSHLVATLCRAQALAVVPADVEAVTAGDELDVLPLLA